MSGLQAAVYLYAGLLLVTAVGLGWVVYRDARLRHASRAAGAGWATGIIVLPLLAIPAYLYLVVRTRVRDGRIKSLDRWIIWAYGSLVLPFGLGAILSPPDPITQLTVQLVAIPPVAIALYHFMFRHGWPGDPQTAPRG